MPVRVRLRRKTYENKPLFIDATSIFLFFFFIYMTDNPIVYSVGCVLIDMVIKRAIEPNTLE